MMDVNVLFRAAPPFLHLWTAPLAEAYEFAWSIQQTPGRQAVVRVIRGSKAESSTALFDECGAALQFPEYFGENWDALLECLTDLEWLPGDAYLLLVTDSHLLLAREPVGQLAALLEVLQNAAQDWARAEDSQGTPRPFHIVFQCAPDGAAALEARIRQTRQPLNPL
jgi:RNAse (barnase) inhibitor barstar